MTRPRLVLVLLAAALVLPAAAAAKGPGEASITGPGLGKALRIAGNGESMGTPLGQITDTLQIFLGSVYVNDFDFNNRSYRVFAQAASRFRARPDDIKQFYVRADSGGRLELDPP